MDGQWSWVESSLGPAHNHWVDATTCGFTPIHSITYASTAHYHDTPSSYLRSKAVLYLAPGDPLSYIPARQAGRADPGTHATPPLIGPGPGAAKLPANQRAPHKTPRNEPTAFGSVDYARNAPATGPGSPFPASYPT